MGEGLITGLDLTLRRMNSIQSSFDKLMGTTQRAQNKEAAEEFKAILDGKLSGTQKSDYSDVLASSKGSSSESINSLIEKYAQKHDLDPDFIRAIVKQESGFNPSAKSKCGAMGLMQLMPATARGLGVANAFDPEQNIEGGVKYIKSMLNRFDQDPKKALAAYNAGPGAVQRYGGIPPYRETQNYVKNIMSMYEKMKYPGGEA